MAQKTAAVILAAGKGTRMKSELPKVLHQVSGRPMLLYVLDLAQSLKIRDTVVVLGYKQEEVRKILPAATGTAVQEQIRGTADAVSRALPQLKGFSGDILVLYGDTPLLRKETIARLLAHHRRYRPAATILTCRMDDPSGYGRIVRDGTGAVTGIVEEKDASAFEKTIREINTGIICFDGKKLAAALKKVRPQNTKKEFYLTDTIGIFRRAGEAVESVESPASHEALGVNSRVELAQANGVMRDRINDELMRKGVSIIDPQTTYISYGTRIGPDTVIYPFTVIEKNVKIGAHCSVGPFCRIRPGTRLNDEVAVGNFIEISRSHLKKGAKAKHFSFLGDARIGSGANIGAGTVTANYDGKNKNISRIGDKAFVGSDTVLVAPVVLGKGAKTGAGAVVVKKKIPAGNIYVGVPAKPINRREK
jgi:bifunctional UDP-N-acetylglucosamine pyrophosphorylase/glucosamine-1-phosphate N-acetyltransferase